MRLAHPLFTEAIEFIENKIVVLDIENPTAYRNAVFSLIAQCLGNEGDFILSDNNVPVDFSKNTEFVPDVFSLDFSGKKLIGQFNKEAEKAADGMVSDIADIMARINDIGFRIVSGMDVNVTFSSVADVASIVKLLNIHVDCEDMTFSEQLIEYMSLYRRFFGKKLFVFLNLKPCLSFDELELFYRSVVYEKYNIMLIENHASEIHTDYEQTVIIDSDLCQI